MRAADEAQAEDLEARLGVVVGQLNAVHAELVGLIAEAATTGAWEGWGVTSLCHWLTWQAGLSRAHALELIRLAEARATHPEISAAFQDGALTVDQAAVAVKVPAHNDAEVAELAPMTTVSQLRTVVRCSQPVVEPAAPEAPTESVRTWFDDDGHYQARISLDADHGRIVQAALQAARDRLFRDGHVGATWIDALLDVAQRSLDNEALSRRERFRVNVFLDPNVDQTARWSDGTPLPDAIHRHLTCDGRLTPTFVESGRPVSVGRSITTIPERTRRLVVQRDGACRVPWCNHSRQLEIHHVVHWKDGGRTDTDNLIALCASCHRLHHRGDLGIAGNADLADGLTFTDRRGRTLTAAPRITRPSGPPPTPGRPFEHPLGERLDRRSLHLSDPPNAPPGSAA
ncbi:MAG: HNH endonuclease [Ilumatobacteraceae bacterium]